MWLHQGQPTSKYSQTTRVKLLNYLSVRAWRRFTGSGSGGPVLPVAIVGTMEGAMAGVWLSCIKRGPLCVNQRTLASGIGLGRVVESSTSPDMTGRQ